jgi:SpoVK/Ycf46/Vps4 family AAA+-type ATPase
MCRVCSSVAGSLCVLASHAWTSSLPIQELDEAARRRMPKQLFIPLPCAMARRKMVEKVFGEKGEVHSMLGTTLLDRCQAAQYMTV